MDAYGQMIDISFQYTTAQYRRALRAKIAAEPNMQFNLAWPIGVAVACWLLVVIVFASHWLSAAFASAVTVYAIAGPVIVLLLPSIAAHIHKSGKLAKTYRFQIDSIGIRRSSGDHDHFFEWSSIQRVDVFGAIYFIHIAQGAFLLPVEYLDEAENVEFKRLCGDRLVGCA